MKLNVFFPFFLSTVLWVDWMAFATAKSSTIRSRGHSQSTDYGKSNGERGTSSGSLSSDSSQDRGGKGCTGFESESFSADTGKGGKGAMSESSSVDSGKGKGARQGARSRSSSSDPSGKGKGLRHTESSSSGSSDRSKGKGGHRATSGSTSRESSGKGKGGRSTKRELWSSVVSKCDNSPETGSSSGDSGEGEIGEILTPTTGPTLTPTKTPETSQPSNLPNTKEPSISATPSSVPSDLPSHTMASSLVPSYVPSDSAAPSSIPSMLPSSSAAPSAVPSMTPSVSVAPSSKPSRATPSSTVPSAVPSNTPSTAPSDRPSLLEVLSLVPTWDFGMSMSMGPPPTPSPTASLLPTIDRGEACAAADAFPTDGAVTTSNGLVMPAPNLTSSCGFSCHRVRNSGVNSTTTIYHNVSDNYFTYKAKVCGVDCDPATTGRYCAELSIGARENFAEDSPFVAATFIPYGRIRYSYRKSTGGPIISTTVAPLASNCMWVMIKRDLDWFQLSFDYESSIDNCAECCKEASCEENHPGAEFCESASGPFPIFMDKEVKLTFKVGNSTNTTEGEVRDIELR